MTPGYYSMPAVKYHADPCDQPSLSNSLAQVLLNESPLKAWHSHPRLNSAYKEQQDDKFDIGTASHAMFLEGDASNIMVVEADDWRTKAAKELREQARAGGKTALLVRHFSAVKRMVDVARVFVAESEIAEYWSQAESEVTAMWEEDGIWLRCRLDRISLNHRCVMDYKSTTDAAPDAFSRQLVRMGYHIQDAFYRRAVRVLDGKDPKFVFLAQSVEPPHECTLHACDPALQEISDAAVERAIDLWRECSERNQWPSYGGRIHWANAPTYLMNQHEQWLAEQGHTA